jgi:hypothetical protein
MTDEQREPTFEEMCRDAIAQGYRRNLDYLEMIEKQNNSMALAMLIPMVFALLIVIAFAITP